MCRRMDPWQAHTRRNITRTCPRVWFLRPETGTDVSSILGPVNDNNILVVQLMLSSLQVTPCQCLPLVAAVHPCAARGGSRNLQPKDTLSCLLKSTVRMCSAHMA